MRMTSWLWLVARLRPTSRKEVEVKVKRPIDTMPKMERAMSISTSVNAERVRCIGRLEIVGGPERGQAHGVISVAIGVGHGHDRPDEVRRDAGDRGGPRVDDLQVEIGERAAQS